MKIERSDQEGSSVGIGMIVKSRESILRTAAAGMTAAISIFAAVSALTQPATPSITSLTPASGPVGTQVTIKGSGFSPAGNTVHFGSGGAANRPAMNRGTIIVYTIPTAVGPNDLNPAIKAASQTVAAGDYPVFVVNAQNQRSNAVSFRVTR